MAGPSSVAILAPNIAPVETLPTAVALPPVATTHHQCGSFRFTADKDTAEKGAYSSLTDSSDMKRTSTAKRPAENLEPGPLGQASSTGVDRHAGVDLGIRSSIEKEEDEATRGEE
jgi:hypothetical protein